MSKLDDLIDQLCPDGVEYKKLGNVCELVRGKGLSKSDKDTGDVPIILYGELYTTYGDYINEVVSHANADVAMGATKIYRNDLLMPVSSTTKEAQIGRVSVYMCDYPAYLGGDAIILRHKLNAAYLMYLLNGSWFEQLKMQNVRGTTISHLNISNLLKIEVPVPPLIIQQKIVEILDKFTSLQAELQAELKLRFQQYEYYRNQLLTFDSDESIIASKAEGVRWSRLDDVCSFVRGKIIPTKDLPEGGNPVIAGGTTPISFTSMSNREGESVAVSGSGAYAGFVSYWNVPTMVTDAFTIEPNDKTMLCVKYLYYFLKNKQNYLYSKKKGAGIPHVHGSDLANLKIPILPLAEQQRIVNILDKFSDYTTSLTNGLPAEIKLRQQQYEYYRDKLLTFRRKGVGR